MKKYNSVILSLGTALMAALPAFGWDRMTVDGVRYWYELTYDRQSVAIVTVGETPAEQISGGAVTVPDTLGGYSVTDIRDAFCEQGSITKVTIPASVTIIGDSCFKNCTSLDTVVFKGRVGDDLDYGSVFENTPFLAKIMGFYGRMDIESTDFCIGCQQKGSRADNNQYDNKEAFPYTGDTGQKWYGFAVTASGYILIDTWKSDCDLVISAYKMTGLDDNMKPILQPVGFSTVTAENASGNVYFPVAKDEMYYVCVEGTKSGPRRARGDFTLQWHFGKTPRKVTLNLHGGTLPCGVASYFLPGYAKGKVKNSDYSTLGELPTPARDGFIFGGWFLDSSYKTKATATTKIKTATTLHAKWSAKSFNLMVLQDPRKGKTVSVTGIPAAIKYKGKKTTLTDSMKVSSSYFCASTLTLAATAMPGYGFDRWIDISNGPGASGSPSVALRKPSTNISMPPHDTIYEATYVAKDEDFVEFENGPTSWYLEDGETNFLIRARSRTYPKKMLCSATKGLLDDVKQGWTYDGTYATVKLTANAKAMKKTGVWTYKVVFTTQSGNAATNTITVYGRNSTAATETTQTSSAKLNGLYTSCHDTPYTNMTVGVKYTADDWALAGITANTEGGWFITSITGIPGLSWSKSARTLTGVPTMAGSFIATITVTKVRGKSSTTAKATALVVVRPLPDWAVGTFKGYTEEYPTIHTENESRTFVAGSRPVTLTIGSTGKVSVNIGGEKYATTGFRRANLFFGEEVYVVEAEFTSKGTGKNKDKIVKRDTIWFSICDGELSAPAFGTINGVLSQWKRETDREVVRNFCASKKDFRQEGGEYLPIQGDSEISADLAHLLCCGSMDSAAMRVFCLSPGWTNKDVFFPDSDRLLLRMVDSDTYYGLAPELLVVNSVDGVATVIGSVTYNGKKYDMSGTAWLDLIKGGAVSDWTGYSRSEKEKYDYLGDAYTDAYYSVVARIMKNGHALEITWHFHKGQAGLVLENVDASFWP